jgi:hypothetical protein
MSDLFDYFEEMGNKVKSVQMDIDATVAKLQKEGEKKDADKKDDKKDKSNKRVFSSNSIEPVTRLRKDVNEVNKAKENPEIQFIKDRIGDIFK